MSYKTKSAANRQATYARLAALLTPTFIITLGFHY